MTRAAQTPKSLLDIASMCRYMAGAERHKKDKDAEHPNSDGHVNVEIKSQDECPSMTKRRRRDWFEMSLTSVASTLRRVLWSILAEENLSAWMPESISRGARRRTRNKEVYASTISSKTEVEVTLGIKTLTGKVETVSVKPSENIACSVLADLRPLSTYEGQALQVRQGLS